MGPIGVQEMIIIFLVALVLFGPRKLPELGKTLAKAMGEFKRAQSDLKATFDREMQAIERETESLKETTQKMTAELNSFSNIDLVGGHSGTYDSHSEAAVTADASSHTSTVSASEVTGAESNAGLDQAGLPPAESHQAELMVGDSSPYPFEDYAATERLVPETGTVARGTNIAVTETAQANRLPDNSTDYSLDTTATVAKTATSPVGEQVGQEHVGKNAKPGSELPSLG